MNYHTVDDNRRTCQRLAATALNLHDFPEAAESQRRSSGDFESHHPEPQDVTVNIYLFRIDEDRHVFYSEGPETLEDPGNPGKARGTRKGFRNWMERKQRYYQLTMARARGGFKAKLRTVWDWLQRFVGPDETLLRGLRKVRIVHLHHPATMSEEQARQAWFGYLAGRKRHHLIWLVVNLLAMSLSVPLAVVPGPNVIGYWFVYRAGCHGLALVGVRRACDRAIVTSLEPSGSLDLPLENQEPGAVEHLARRCGLRNLDVFLVRIGAMPAEEESSKGDEAGIPGPMRASGEAQETTRVGGSG